MSRLINADALLDAIKADRLTNASDAIYFIENAPTIEADSGEPVAFKHEIYMNKRCVETWYDDIKNPAADTVITPLYTSPQQREWKDIDLSEYENQGLGVIAEEICTKLKQLNSEKG